MSKSKGHSIFNWSETVLRVVMLCLVVLVTFDLVIAYAHTPVEMNSVEVVSSSGDQDSEPDVVKQLLDGDLIEFRLSFFEFLDLSTELRLINQLTISGFPETFSPPPES